MPAVFRVSCIERERGSTVIRGIVLQVAFFLPSGANTTCGSLNNLAMEARSLSHLGFSEECNTTDGCLGIQCTAHVPQGSQTYSKVVLLPCQRPRAIHIISVYNDQVLLNDVINESKVFNYTLLGIPLEINVTFEDRNKSVLLGVSYYMCHDIRNTWVVTFWVSIYVKCDVV